jgi:pimeloyl-ACP methyl ester carboxylesterase
LLDQLGGDQTDRFPDVCLVGHSLGGLVAREMTESPADNDAKWVQRNLVQLITIGTPHHGSQWANLPPVAELLSNDADDAGGIVDVLLHRPSAASMRDLMPGSLFLTELNSRPRRDDVRYTSMIGTASPMSASDVNVLRQMLKSMDQSGTPLRLIRPRIRPLLESFDELTAGKGDGIVSVKSAHLPGIDDNIEIAVSHFDMIQNDRRDNDPVLNLLMERLNQVGD